MIRWIRGYGKHIRVLAVDALLSEGTSYAVPILIAGVLPARDFGIYRGISNTAVPVRLIIMPIRPWIASRASGYFSLWRIRGMLVAGASLVGLSVGSALQLIKEYGILEDSALAALSSYALPAALYVIFNMMSFVYFITNRVGLPGKILISLRVWQAAFGFAGPAIGLVAGGLDGAIVGFVSGAALNALAGAIADARWCRST
jgi:hypothetical protein